jgi:hypothetical protein
MNVVAKIVYSMQIGRPLQMLATNCMECIDQNGIREFLFNLIVESFIMSSKGHDI